MNIGAAQLIERSRLAVARSLRTSFCYLLGATALLACPQKQDSGSVNASTNEAESNAGGASNAAGGAVSAAGGVVNAAGGAGATRPVASVLAPETDPTTMPAAAPGATFQGADPRVALRVLPSADWRSLAGDKGGGVCIAEYGQPSFLKIRRLTPDGQELWDRSFPTIEAGQVMALAGGDCAIFGTFRGTLKSGAPDLVSVDNPAAQSGSAVDRDETYERGQPSADGVLARLSEGEVSWALAFSGPGRDAAQVALELDSGELLVAGEFVAEVSAGEHSLSSATGSVESRTYLARVTADGTPTRLSELSVGAPQVIAANSDGSGVVGGWRRTSGAYSVSRFDALGQPSGEAISWAEGTAQLSGLALDEQSNLYLAVHGNNGEVFMGEPLRDAIALAKLDAAGQRVWLKTYSIHSVNPKLSLRGAALTLAGNFRDVADFGAGPMASSGGADGFLAEYDLDGNLRFALRVGGAEADYVLGLFPTERGWVGGLYLETRLALGPEGTVLPAGSSIVWLDVSGE